MGTRRLLSNLVQSRMVTAAAAEGLEYVSTDDRPECIAAIVGRTNAFNNVQICSAGNESQGRGQVWKDILRFLPGGAFTMESLKITMEDRAPRSICLYTGTENTARLFERNLMAPDSTTCEAFNLIAINWNPKTGEWLGLRADVKALAATHGNAWPQASGKRGVPLVKSWARRPSGGGTFEYPRTHPKHGELMAKRHKWYLSGRVNVKPAGLEWVSLGTSAGEPTPQLLNWAVAQLRDAPVTGRLK